MLTLSSMSFCGFVALSAYVVFPLNLPEALWGCLPMLLIPFSLLWGWHGARRKRIAAERYLERYRAGLQQTISGR